MTKSNNAGTKWYEPIEKRLYKFIRKDESGCWIWTGCLSVPAKYAKIKLNGKMAYAHRISYELHKGKIPAGLNIDHLCRNTRCVNPDHLEAVTQLENMRRATLSLLVDGKRRDSNYCGRGHEFTEENTVIRIRNGRKSRICNECKKIWAACYRRRKGIPERRAA